LNPGHEIAGGVVDSLGEEAQGFTNDEKVLVYPWIGEGLCPAERCIIINIVNKDILNKIEHQTRVYEARS
jgi:propanol-preferring alcohol dehydrogenase